MSIYRGTGWSLFVGSSEDVLPTIAADSIDALITDPPAGIGFMGKAWDTDRGGRNQWIAWLTGIMRECYRAMKPGAHGLVWALPRTSHWTATACEDAGFEIRDVVMHLHGQGFPKSLDVSKAIDARAIGANQKIRPTSREVLSTRDDGTDTASRTTLNRYAGERDVTAPATTEAAQWSGWGTSLKPAYEGWVLVRKPIAEFSGRSESSRPTDGAGTRRGVGSENWVLIRKPFDGTVANNVLRYGTGALNIDGCRIGDDVAGWTGCGRAEGGTWDGDACGLRAGIARPVAGRWPANVVLDEEAAAMLDEQSGIKTSSGGATRRTVLGRMNDDGWKPPTQSIDRPCDTGGASRFFYVAKASTAEKSAGLDARNDHPTVKSIALMRWLARLITPPGGTVLDPFAGSGTTMVAARMEGANVIGIEQDPGHASKAERRVRHWAPDEEAA